AFLAKFTGDLSDLVFFTYIGGSDHDYATAVALVPAYPPGGGTNWDEPNQIANEGWVFDRTVPCVVGYTWNGATDFPTTTGAYDPNVDGVCDAFLCQFDSFGRSLLYSTVLGGGGTDYGYAVAAGTNGDVYITGYTHDANTDYPTTPGAYDQTHNGTTDAFVSKFTIGFDGQDSNAPDYTHCDDTALFVGENTDGNCVFEFSKYIWVRSDWTSGHCETEVTRELQHIHFETDPNVANANRFWDWYYDVGTSGVTRDSDATNLRESIAYALDGWTDGDYNYWL
ncbi:unnamed protein product, partial [marine sediment metagenome]